MRRITRFVREVCVLPIRFYQRFVSPWTPASCRFSPTCSHYAVEAVRRHGVWRGGWLTVKRLLRCQPFCEGGYDPVPEPRDQSPHR